MKKSQKYANQNVYGNASRYACRHVCRYAHRYAHRHALRQRQKHKRQLPDCQLRERHKLDFRLEERQCDYVDWKRLRQLTRAYSASSKIKIKTAAIHLFYA